MGGGQARRGRPLLSQQQQDAQPCHSQPTTLRFHLPAPLPQSCGIQSEVCEAAVAALQVLPRLREVQLALRRALPASTAGALATACCQLSQLTHLDVHLPGYTLEVPAVPAWRQLSTLTGLRRLHASTGMGWDGAAFAAVAAAATGLRGLTLTDNAGAMRQEWAAALAPLHQLSQLRLNSCTCLGGDAARELCRLTSLTSLQAFRWAGRCLAGRLPALASACPPPLDPPSCYPRLRRACAVPCCDGRAAAFTTPPAGAPS